MKAFLLLIAILAIIRSTSAYSAVAFDLPASGAGNTVNKRCFTLYIGRDVMVAGTYTSTASTGSSLNFQVVDIDGNVYNTRNDANELERFSFTSHSHSDFMFCFTNVLNAGVYPNAAFTKTISLNLKIGSEAMAGDSNALNKDSLKPIEVELNVLEQVVKDAITEMEYLKQREMKMRDTNESTNSRVKWFSLFSMCILIGSGIWQILYLRMFFQSKKIL